MTIDTRIRESFSRQAMMTTLGAEIDQIAPGAVAVSAPISPGITQQQGYAHGALAFAIGDSAAGYSALSLLSEADEVVTSEMSIHYLAPGSGSRLVARGRVIKPGRRLLVVRADVFAVNDGAETLIATLTGTMVRVPA